MNILNRLFARKTTKNLVVYVLSAIIDGNAKATPVGSAPRFSRAAEKNIEKRHRPAENTIIDEHLIMCWANGGIEAIAFVGKEHAEAFPGFKPFTAADLAKLDPYLRHFPR